MWSHNPVQIFVVIWACASGLTSFSLSWKGWITMPVSQGLPWRSHEKKAPVYCHFHSCVPLGHTGGITPLPRRTYPQPPRVSCAVAHSQTPPQKLLSAQRPCQGCPAGVGGESMHIKWHQCVIIHIHIKTCPFENFNSVGFHIFTS